MIDARLVVAAQAGDQDAFRSLVDQLAQPLCRMAYRITGQAQDAEDAWQNALLRAWRHLPELRDPRMFRGWLTRVVINEAKSLVSQRSRAPLVTADLPDIAVESFTSPADWLTLQSCLRLLPPEQREVIVMRYWLDLPLQSIADTVRVPLSTVKTRLYRGMELLRDILEPAESRRD